MLLARSYNTHDDGFEKTERQPSNLRAKEEERGKIERKK